MNTAFDAHNSCTWISRFVVERVATCMCICVGKWLLQLVARYACSSNPQVWRETESILFTEVHTFVRLFVCSYVCTSENILDSFIIPMIIID